VAPPTHTGNAKTEGRKNLLELYRTQPQHLKDIQRERFEQHLFDVNGDGSIDIEEARMAQALEMATDGLEVDVDGDGLISQDERFIERQIKGREMVVKVLLDT
jgi:hypothetical protein